MQTTASGPLAGVRVLDLATLFAGPFAATMLADFGASVVKVEHPDRPDAARGHGARKDGIGLWWKTLNRNKQTATLNLKSDRGKELLLGLCAETDVVIENFRPGTLERWGLDYETLREANPGLILARVTGFGQQGPMAHRPGFGTLAEAMSGFAHVTGEPDGPPTLPPLALADHIAGLAVANAVLVALHARENTGNGQVIDLAIIEPILAMLGSQITNYDQLGLVPQRRGNRSENNAPRNTYRTADGRWLAISTSAQSIAERVMHLVGAPELTEKSWFATGSGRAAHADELDDAVGRWIAERSASEVIEEFERAEAAVAPVYDVADIVADPQYNAIGSIVSVEDSDLGTLKMQNVLARLSETPGCVRHPGRDHGADNAAVFARLGITPEELTELAERGVI